MSTEPMTQAAAVGDGNLKIEVAPNIVEDLGVNLYTTVARVLVEFVANAYDADAEWATVTFDRAKIDNARADVKKEWEYEKAAIDAKKLAGPLKDLDGRTLPDTVNIQIVDNGHGMDRERLQNHFLRISRRRRKDGKTSPNGRPLMGRKGLGKLAGFGVARILTVTSKVAKIPQAIKITLDLQELLGHETTKDVSVKTETMPDDDGLGEKGTRVVLSRLFYGAARSRDETIGEALAEHFRIVDTIEFLIGLNGDPVVAAKRPFAWAWPDPDNKNMEELVVRKITGEDGSEHTFKYRIRFTERGNHLPLAERGVRIYAHRRLASAPTLLDLAPGMHGFKNTHYLDGVVEADFIDDFETDFVATDRHSLRWETPILAAMREVLTKEMDSAIREYQKFLEKEADKTVREDPYTKDLITRSELPSHRKKVAYSIASALASSLGGGVADTYYKKVLPMFVQGLGQGDIEEAIEALAASNDPDLFKLVAEITRLTNREFGDFVRIVNTRLKAIDALRGIYDAVTKSGKADEKELHDLLKENSWLIDPTFSQFLTSNEQQAAVKEKLRKELKIDKYATPPKSKADQKRPDLVFLLGNISLRRLVIVELKAPNVELEFDHLTQLKDYVMDAESFLKKQGGAAAETKVTGILIGTRGSKDSGKKGVQLLWQEEEKQRMDSSGYWQVFDLSQLLERTAAAHRELLDAYDKAADEDG